VPAVVTCQAVLFDMDGTLVDSTAVVERQWARWAARRRVSLAAVLAVSHGRPTLETLSLVAPQWATRAEAEAVEATEAGDDEGIVAVTGARELASALPAGAWGVVTSAGRALAIARLTAAGLPVPHVLITADDVPRGKPDPAGYREAARRLAARPEHCLVFEDAPVGVRAGLEAGSMVIGLTTTFDDLDGCAHRVADLSSVRLVDGGPPLRLEVRVGSDGAGDEHLGCPRTNSNA
jgi:mannitol-1-/sugar-/sorbitol-6-phosphatase